MENEEKMFKCNDVWICLILINKNNRWKIVCLRWI
jgi:hypothetical protein